MIKAVIFDCFDVLVSNGLPILTHQYVHDDPAKERQIIELEQALNEGRIAYEIFILKISEIVGLDTAQVRAMLDDNRPDEALFSYISNNLYGKYKLAILSNAGDDWLDEMLGAERVKLFDTAVLSYQVGYTKPQPEIYELTAERLGVAPEECIFVDDKARFCDGARAVGMQAICYQSFRQFERDLSATLSI